jgi:hypothetical protein
VLVIDYSGSQFPYIKNSVDAAAVLVDKLGPRDRMAIVTDDVEMLVDFTNDKRELKKKLNTLLEKSKGNDGFLGVGGTRQQFGKSAQYSALMATLKEAFDEKISVRSLSSRPTATKRRICATRSSSRRCRPIFRRSCCAKFSTRSSKRKQLQRAGYDGVQSRRRLPNGREVARDDLHGRAGSEADRSQARTAVQTLLN